MHMRSQHEARPRQTTKYVAELLDLSVSQVARYGAQLGVEKLPGRTGHYLFTEADIEQIRELRAGTEAAAS